MHIAILTPAKTFTPEYVKSLLTMNVWALRNKHSLSFHTMPSSDIYVGRNLVLKDVIDNKPDYDYLLWVDSDQGWTPENVQMLIEDDKEVISGLTPIDGKGNTQCGFFGGEWAEYVNEMDVDQRETVFEIDFCGFGFVLMKHGVIERMEYPWFRFFLVDMPDGSKSFGSEDISFSRWLTKVGIPIYVDGRVRVSHQKYLTTRLPAWEDKNG